MNESSAFKTTNNSSSTSHETPCKSPKFEATMSDKVVKKKGRGCNKEYEKLETQPDYNSALEYMLKNMKNYHFRYTKETNDGDKKYYTCNGFSKCPKVVYILLHADSQDCSIWQCTSDHNHDAKETKLPAATVEVVKKCIKSKITTNQTILNKIREQMLPEITRKQLNNLKSRLITHVKSESSRKRGRPIQEEDNAFSDEDDQEPKDKKRNHKKRKATEDDSEYYIFSS